MAGIAAHARDGGMTHRRTFVRNDERREIGRTVAGLTGGRADGNVVGWRFL